MPRPLDDHHSSLRPYHAAADRCTAEFAAWKAQDAQPALASTHWFYGKIGNPLEQTVFHPIAPEDLARYDAQAPLSAEHKTPRNPECYRLLLVSRHSVNHGRVSVFRCSFLAERDDWLIPDHH
ncbi:Uncharacterised protein [Vibrio cholerae]|nr:Uncharacterised protein [Vibrio cholerae]